MTGRAPDALVWEIVSETASGPAPEVSQQACGDSIRDRSRIGGQPLCP